MGRIKKVYRAVYGKSPKVLKGWMTRLVFNMPNKPFVKLSPIPFEERFPETFRGALIISADFEMAWAWRYAKSGVDPEEMGLIERRNIPALLELFEKYSIPATWATVGHLFLERCTKKNDLPHHNMPRIPHFTNPKWSFLEGDWFDHDPCSDYVDAGAWYAPDLIDRILASKVRHEIGCHTFSHIDCSDRMCPDNVMDHEIRACVEIAHDRGISLKSMVFPGGTNGHYKVLKKYGFTNYRIRTDWDLFYPERDRHGLWMLPSSTSIENHGFGWSADFYDRMYRKYVDRAIESGTVCHLWFHPSIDAFCLNDILPMVLSHIRRRYEEGKLWVATMSEMASYCESTSEC